MNRYFESREERAKMRIERLEEKLKRLQDEMVHDYDAIRSTKTAIVRWKKIIRDIEEAKRGI